MEKITATSACCEKIDKSRNETERKTMNVTRTFINFKCRAYAIEVVDGAPTLAVIAECEAQATSMTKAHARAALAESYGKVLPQGCAIEWEALAKITYAMPQHDFLANAQIIKTEEVKQG